MSSSADCYSVSPERHTPQATTHINKNAPPIAHHQSHLFVFFIIILLSVTEEYTPHKKSPMPTTGLTTPCTMSWPKEGRHHHTMTLATKKAPSSPGSLPIYAPW